MLFEPPLEPVVAGGESLLEGGRLSAVVRLPEDSESCAMPERVTPLGGDMVALATRISYLPDFAGGVVVGVDAAGATGCWASAVDRFALVSDFSTRSRRTPLAFSVGRWPDVVSVIADSLF